jgi:hypothetical protein
MICYDLKCGMANTHIGAKLRTTSAILALKIVKLDSSSQKVENASTTAKAEAHENLKMHSSTMLTLRDSNMVYV